MNTGEKIAAARKAKGWSQEDLGWKVGVSTQAVSKWENNLSEPDKDDLLRLSPEFGTAESLLSRNRL
jgi:transcriptional regulator with XRE-family HTH domain